MNILPHIPESVMNCITQRRDSTPIYVYDTETIQEHCRLFRSIEYGRLSIHFASMANNNPYFLSLIRKQGLCVFVNSLKHLNLCLKVGFTGNEIIYTASALDVSTMEQIYQSGASFNADSLTQIEQWFSHFPQKPIGIRCNIGEKVNPVKTRAGYFLGKSSRLGLSLTEILSLQDHPRIHGLHLYAGTDIIDMDYFFDCYRIIAELIHLFPNLTSINFGGGFGIDKNTNTLFDIPAFGLRLTEFMNTLCEKSGKKLTGILEPGRIIGSTAGYFVCSVTDIKIRNSVQYIGVNASSVQFPRPLLYPLDAVHPVGLLRNAQIVNKEDTVDSTVYGCSTYSRDFLAHHASLPPAKLGDTVVFGNAGSYCASSHCQFLGFEKVYEVFV